MTKTPRSCRILCASGVVGPLAPSVTIFALIVGAFSVVIWFSSAAGIRMSTSSDPQLVVGQRFAAGKAVDRLVLAGVYSSSFGMSRPLAL